MFTSGSCCHVLVALVKRVTVVPSEYQTRQPTTSVSIWTPLAAEAMMTFATARSPRAAA
jgi:hypothetical protein